MKRIISTENDLEFVDFVLTTSGHAEMYIDANHTWGWGDKHCTMFDMNGNLGWEGTFKKESNTNYLKWNSRIGRKRNNNSIVNHDDRIDKREYKYIISPNPNKKNMIPKFNVEG